ncbi:hypothetical protein PGB90_000294 [Kerria lacca]
MMECQIEFHFYEKMNFDVRGRPFSKALCWSEPNIFGPRAYFVTIPKPAGLRIDHIQLDDEGSYRCRVDFRNSPTRNFQINLTVIVPPNQLILYDISSRELNDIVGPMTEGSDLVLTCEVRGGKPLPTVSWFENERLVNGRVDTNDHRVTVNKLEIPRVQRTHLNSTYKCQASNTNLVLPTQKTVRLELILRPLLVKLRTKPTSLIAGEEYVITCESQGSRPQAVLSWWMDEKMFEDEKMENIANETVALSSIRFFPKPKDDGRFLKCRGENPELAESVLEDSLLFNVVCGTRDPPIVDLRLGNNLNAVQIKEGEDVYFECKIRSNPREYKIIWLKNDNQINQDLSSGIIISTHSLVLQKISRHNSGNYTCTAANERGESSSQPVPLRVQFSPVCVTNEVTVIGGSLGETLHIRCHVAADPTNLTISWQFSSSEKNHPLTTNHSLNDTVSELIYKVMSERDYGTLACWADNAIGRQVDPCIFHIVPAARPEAVRNCSVKTLLNSSEELMIVECIAGYDGGLPQSFHLEVLESETKRLHINLTRNQSPVFRIDGTSFNDIQGTVLHLLLYSANQKGRSEAVLIEDIPLNGPEKRTEWKMDDNENNWNTGQITIFFLGLALLIGSSVLLMIIIATRRRCNESDDVRSTTKHVKLPISSSENTYTVAYQLKSESKQPDIISRVNSDNINQKATDKNEENKSSNFATIIHNNSNGSSPSCQDSGTSLLSIKAGSYQKPLLNTTVSKKKPVISQIPGPESCV